MVCLLFLDWRHLLKYGEELSVTFVQSLIQSSHNHAFSSKRRLYARD